MFVAGATTMSTEMCASRLLAPFFGASILIWANIIGLILIYLSVGYFVGGRLADRHPTMRFLCWLMLAAAGCVAVLPFVAEPFLSAAVDAFAGASVGAFLGSFFAVMLLFSAPITLLGMASPFAVRLGVTTIEEAGAVAGRMYALSTAGSIIGTFLPVAVLIPAIGTRRTMLATACLLALAASPVLGRRYLAVPALIGAVALVPPGAVKPGSHIIYEGESAYQFVQVQSLPGGGRVLHLNEGWADHSIYRPGQVLTGGYWDQFLLAPILHGPGFRSLSMIGYAGGTVGRAYGTYWPSVNVLGIELDPLVTQVGRRYFGLASNPRVRVATADGRVYLEQHHTRYDAVFLDAFRQPYIPFYLTTQEFWSLARERLQRRGHGDGERGPHPGRLAPAGCDRGDDGDPVRIGLRVARNRVQRHRRGVHVADDRRGAPRPPERRPARPAARRRPGPAAPARGAVGRSPDRRPGARRVDDGPDDRPLRRRDAVCGNSVASATTFYPIFHPFA